jgi:hypothetical protein
MLTFCFKEKIALLYTINIMAMYVNRPLSLLIPRHSSCIPNHFLELYTCQWEKKLHCRPTKLVQCWYSHIFTHAAFVGEVLPIFKECCCILYWFWVKLIRFYVQTCWLVFITLTLTGVRLPLFSALLCHWYDTELWVLMCWVIAWDQNYLFYILFFWDDCYEK